MVTQTQLREYLSTLDQSLQDVYGVVSAFVYETEDILGEDFQVASELQNVFWSRCKLREEWKR